MKMILDGDKSKNNADCVEYKKRRINPDMDLERVLHFVAEQNVKNEIEFERKFGLPDFFISSLFDRDYTYPMIYYMRLAEIMEVQFTDLFFFLK